MMPRWPEEREDTLRELWGRGITTNVIAPMMGLSRGSVAGKLYRLGLMGNNPKSEINQQLSSGHANV